MFEFIQRRPRLFLALFTLLVFAVVTRGGFADADTARRLQVTHSLWSDAPQVAAADRNSSPPSPGAAQLAVAPGFCDLPGPDGRINAQFSIGQSLLMLPADLAAAAARGELSAHPTNFFLHNWTVNLVTFPPVAVAGVLLSFELLTVLGFTLLPALAASVFLLMGTTFVLYVQDSAENSQLYALYVGALVALLKSDAGNVRRNMLIAGACAGAGLLFKLPFVANIAALGLVAKFASDRAAGQGARGYFNIGPHTLRDALWFAAPVVAAIGVDRIYHFHRFAELTGTYMKHCVAAFARLDGYPADYPFGYPLAKGVLGPIVDPRRSVFVFDPFLAVALGFIATGWRGLGAERRLVVVSTLAAFVMLLLIFGGSWYWNGGFGSWGARHHLVPVELLCLIGLALAFEKLPQLGRFARGALALGASLGVLGQAIALPIPAGLEQAQALEGDPLRAIQLLRLRNLYYLATDRLGEIAAQMHDKLGRDFVLELVDPLTGSTFFILRVAAHLDQPAAAFARGLWWTLSVCAFAAGLYVLLRCAAGQRAGANAEGGRQIVSRNRISVL